MNKRTLYRIGSVMWFLLGMYSILWEHKSADGIGCFVMGELCDMRADQ